MQQNQYTTDDLIATAKSVRRLVLEAVHHAGSGHAGSSLSIVDLLVAIYCDKISLLGADRDRFVLSKGHAAPALYAVLCELELISKEELLSLRQYGSRLQGHPDRTKLDLIDAGTGALGQGLSISIGYALAAKRKGASSNVFCIIGDGEIQEGQIWEAALYAPHARLDNLYAIVDFNKLQNETFVEDTLPLDPLAEKWRAFGWNTLEIDGHDMAAVRDALNSQRIKPGKPTAIIANTVKGKGVSFMENNNAWHGGVINDDQLKLALSEL